MQPAGTATGAFPRDSPGAHPALRFLPAGDPGCLPAIRGGAPGARKVGETGGGLVAVAAAFADNSEATARRSGLASPGGADRRGDDE